MTDDVDRCRAEIRRLRAIAEQATPGPWIVPPAAVIWTVRTPTGDDWVAEASPADSEHIAACDPQVMIRRYDIDLDRLDQHAEDDEDDEGWCAECLPDWPCGTVQGVLAYYPQDGARTARGGPEPGTPSSLPDPPAEKPQNGAQ